MKFRAAAAVALASALVANSSALAAACQDNLAQFTGRDRLVEITVEIADDVSERARGLMFRRELPAGQGMLFIYDEPQPVSFWMRNTLIPLDMIFIDARGEVRRVHPMAQPLDETPIPGATGDDPAPDRLMVLEIAGGEAARLGIEPGMVLSHPRLPQDTALAPCQ
ncbi:hypothetical protein SAMN04487972_101245 [Paracoccus halophilus]|uniref:DUF192 domain-containing protein n=1 Tax=Paracoccus halophilus TaxID=376733 RepID=A0A099F3X2_9RHOB|nr:DUF192 domain-containing protein [Paracoccus halophilus]KGJ04921.1 hypothetical protein IT41_07765 [Paracoccus halophilus]SFA39109.1 hypothetical protein SAMN04487972_101245 [Paracoccus halophilus]